IINVINHYQTYSNSLLNLYLFLSLFRCLCVCLSPPHCIVSLPPTVSRLFPPSLSFPPFSASPSLSVPPHSFSVCLSLPPALSLFISLPIPRLFSSPICLSVSIPHPRSVSFPHPPLSPPIPSFSLCPWPVLEVLQFGRDAAVAETWLSGQEPYVRAADIGSSVDDVENLIKRHEAFEKSAVGWEERFLALEKLTTLEQNEIRRAQEEEERRKKPSPPPSPTKPHDGEEHGNGLPGETKEIIHHLEPIAQNGMHSDMESPQLTDDFRQMNDDGLLTVVGTEKSVTLSEASEPVNGTGDARQDGSPRGSGKKPHPATPLAPASVTVTSKAPEPSGLQLEGGLCRKQEWESHNKKASSRWAPGGGGVGRQ
uniref:Spectrin beta chain, non-erythrocytic 1-like n=1 Tax=Callorhinchus milii TaxID=7868 RepID=A0A4W3GVP3_CALMI